jgi:hypothetical protein
MRVSGAALLAAAVMSAVLVLRPASGLRVLRVARGRSSP